MYRDIDVCSSFARCRAFCQARYEIMMLRVMRMSVSVIAHLQFLEQFFHCLLIVLFVRTPSFS